MQSSRRRGTHRFILFRFSRLLRDMPASDEPLLAAAETPAPSTARGMVSIMRGNALNLLLPVVAVAMWMDQAGFPDGVVFLVSCLGLLPLAGLLVR